MFKHLSILAVVGLFLGFNPTANADFKDFINQSKYGSDIKACDERMYKYWDKCNYPDQGKEHSCRQKAVKLNAKCKKTAEKNAIYIVNLPEKAQLEYAKIVIKQEKAIKKCDNKVNKGLKKCKKRASGNEKKEKACDDKVIINYITCREKVLIKHNFETKKMKRLLKGIRP